MTQPVPAQRPTSPARELTRLTKSVEELCQKLVGVFDLQAIPQKKRKRYVEHQVAALSGVQNQLSRAAADLVGVVQLAAAHQSTTAPESGPDFEAARDRVCTARDALARLSQILTTSTSQVVFELARGVQEQSIVEVLGFLREAEARLLDAAAARSTKRPQRDDSAYDLVLQRGFRVVLKKHKKGLSTTDSILVRVARPVVSVVLASVCALAAVCAAAFGDSSWKRAAVVTAGFGTFIFATTATAAYLTRSEEREHLV